MENEINKKIDEICLELETSSSPQRRRHLQDELKLIENYLDTNPNNLELPSYMELYCNSHPDSLECRLYEV